MNLTTLVTYRNRPSYLKTFLETLDIAAKSHAFKDHDQKRVIIVDLGSDLDSTKAIITKSMGSLCVDHCYIPYTDLFWKTKALNHGLGKCQSVYVSIVDIDCLFSPNYYASIDHFFADPVNEQKKLGWNIKYLDELSSKRCQTIDGYFNDEVVAKEAWWAKHQSPRPMASVTFRNLTFGNSHMTIKRQTLLDVGGLNEKFVGYGMEDWELNMRLYTAGIETVINPHCALYHYRNKYEGDWRSNATEAAGWRVFKESEGEGFRGLLKDKMWGNW